MCPQGSFRADSKKLHFFQGNLSQTSKKFILRALINFHYVMIFPISIKKYLIIINQHPMISMLRAKCALRAVSGQIFIFQGSLRAHFIRHRRFPYLGHIFLVSGQISGQSTDNTILNWHRRFPYSGHIQGTQGTQGRFLNSSIINIQNLKFIKFENECDFVIFENVAKNHSFTPDVSLCTIA